MNRARITNSRGNNRHLYLCLLCLIVSASILWSMSCGGGESSVNPNEPPDPSAATPLTVAQIQTIIQNAVTSVNAPMTVAVVDRLGEVLAVFNTANAPATAIANFGQSLPAGDVAVGLARTAAFFSNDQAPLSSRTVRYISGIHFPPGVANTPNADLYGIENTNRGCTLSNNYLPNQAYPPALTLEGKTGLGIITGKADTNDDQPFAVNPGGVPIFNPLNPLEMVGGVGVVSSTPEIAEYAAFSASANSGFLPSLSQLPPPGVVIIGGIALPFVNQTTLPAGASAGSMANYTGGTYAVAATAETMNGAQPPFGWVVGPNTGTASPLSLTSSQVSGIIMAAVATANITRAVIRLPPDSGAKMTIAVSDLDGTILGLYHMVDGTVFSVDVAASKARNVVWFSTTGSRDLPGVPTGTAVTNRTVSFGAQPLFPPGITGSNDGPFFQTFLLDVANPCTQGSEGASGPGQVSPNPNTNNMSGIVFFPGSLPLYNSNGQLVGGLGVSGDGVDQDDFVTAGAAVGAACSYATPDNVAMLCPPPQGSLVTYPAPVSIQADQVVIDNVRLPYQKFPRNPTN